jgi:signal transduction histidine kinase
MPFFHFALRQHRMWAVPLWNVSGLAGALYLGARQDGSLYTQEEIDIARITGERLLDTMASAEVTRRLMLLQRQQMAEGQVLDRRTRRVLHDEVLPQIHATMLSMSVNQGDRSTALTTLSAVHQQIAALLRDVPIAETPTLAEWGLVSGIRRIAYGEFGEAFDEIEWQVNPRADEMIHDLAPTSAEVIFYAAREAIRNAAQHGRLIDQPLTLNVNIDVQDGFQITICDDGVGMAEADPDPQGHGLELHRTLMAVIGGKLEIESQADTYTLVRLSLQDAK